MVERREREKTETERQSSDSGNREIGGERRKKEREEIQTRQREQS